jgi:hypothetical protein
MNKLFRTTTVIITMSMAISCTVEGNEYNLNFIKEHGNEKFSDFINVGIVVRNFDQKGNVILFVSNLKNSKTNGIYIVTVDTAKKTIVETSCKLIQDSLLIDRVKLDNLAIKFVKYDINMLRVDSNETVFINVNYNERPTLVRFADLKFKTATYNKDWKRIKENWYEDELNP